MFSLHVKRLQTWRRAAASSAPGFHPKEDSRGNLPVSQELFPDSVRMIHEHPVVKGEGEGERRRKRKEKALTEAQSDAGDDGGDEWTGGDIQEAEGSGDRVPSQTNSSVDGATADEMKTKMRTRCQDALPRSDGESDDGFEDEDERVVP